jgi:hypothetical protein
MRGILWKWMNSLEDLECVDDTCLLPYKYDHIRLQSKQNDLCTESRKTGLMINYAKTEEIRANNSIENREMERVTDFCYLGSTWSGHKTTGLRL